MTPDCFYSKINFGFFRQLDKFLVNLSNSINPQISRIFEPKSQSGVGRPDWRFYNYGTAGQPSLQLIAPEVKAWSTLVWQKRGTDPDSDSAMTIAKADYEKLKGFFENYTDDESSWKEYQISGLEAARYFATYQEKGKQMVEYRTYILGESLVYWFVFRIEKDKFEASKAEFDSIISSFKANAR